MSGVGIEQPPDQSSAVNSIRGDVTAIDSFGVDELVANMAVTLRDADAGPVTVAAGTFEQTMVYEVMLSGPIVAPTSSSMSRSAPTT
jgi:hypothetical protein